MRTGILLTLATVAIVGGAVAASHARGSDIPLWQRDSGQQLAALPLPLPDSLRAGATFVGVTTRASCP